MSLNRNIDTGSYSGNGTSQSITIGWQPALVVIFSDQKAAQGGSATFKTPDMSSDNAMTNRADADYISGTITLTSTGFSVGNADEVNDNGVTHWWIAFRDRFTIDYGAYSGTSDPPPKIITTNRQPSAVFVFRLPGVNTQRTNWKTASMSGAFAASFQLVYDYTDNLITLTSTGFELSSSLYQSIGDNYVWVALYGTVGSTQHFETGSYTGTATSQSITLGFQPRSVFVFEAGTDDNCGFKIDTIPIATIGALVAGYAVDSAGMAISTTGFTVPLNSDLNKAGRTYHYLAGRY